MASASLLAAMPASAGRRATPAPVMLRAAGAPFGAPAPSFAPRRLAGRQVAVRPARRAGRVAVAAAAAKPGDSAAAPPPPPPELSPWAMAPPAAGADVPPPPPGAPLYPPGPYAGNPYASAYPGYYPPPPPPPAKSSSLPPWMWVALGVGLAGLAGKLMEGAKAKQADIQQAMMQQMLKSMMGGAGGAPGAGGMPPGFPGMGGMPPPPAGGFGGARPGAAAAGAARAAPAVDVTATPVSKPAAEQPKPAAAAAAAAAPPPVSPPQPKEEAPKATSSSSSYFRDAEVMDAEAGASSSSSSSSAGAGGAGSVPGGGAAGGMSVDMLEMMMKDPNMQKMIYPYLPEGMRNPQTFEWMLSNPATRKQLESMLANGGGMTMAPGVNDMLKNFDMNSPEVQQQFQQMGMKPEDVISKIMANPEMTAAFQNPRIQAAIMDCSANPMNITKYQDDAEVMETFEKIAALFPNAGGMGPPPGFGR